jgi:hypothetical protein
MILKIFNRFIFFKIVLGSCLAHAIGWELHSYRNPLSLSQENRALLPARGFQIQDSLRIMLGHQGVSTWDGPEGSTLTLVGPALVDVYPDKIILEYGELYLRFGSAALDITVFCLDLQILVKPQSEFIVTRRPQAQRYELLQMGKIPLKLYQDRDLAPRELLLKGDGINESEVLSEKKIKTERSRFWHLRHLKDFSESKSHELEFREIDSLDRFFESGLTAGFTRLSPVSGTTYVQNLGGMGFYLKRGWSSYWGFPSDPSLVTREHYLYKNSLRWGILAHFLSFWIEPTAGYNMKSQSFAAGAFAGWAWEGLSFDALGGYAFDINTLSRRGFKLRWPVFLGFDTRYRVDLSRLMDSEMGLDLGLRYTTHFMTRNISVPSAVADTVSLPNFRTDTWALLVGLSFRF